MIPSLNTDTPQFSDNSTIPSISTGCNTPQLANIVDKSSTNHAREKIEGQLIAMKSYIECETSNIDKKIKSLYECFNGVKETKKSNLNASKNITFLQNELIRKDELIKTLLDTQTSILETVSKLSVEEEKKEEEVSPTRNKTLEEIQWQKQSSGRKNKNEPKIYTFEVLVLIPELMIPRRNM